MVEGLVSPGNFNLTHTVFPLKFVILVASVMLAPSLMSVAFNLFMFMVGWIPLITP